MINACRHLVGEGQLLGMGTICTVEEARQAIDAGAMFLVTPNLSTKVIEYGLAHNIPVVAGALTPTEVYDAWSAGASMIKVFPCQAMGGPQYIKELRGPFNTIPLVAVGGVSLENLADYFKAGVQGVGVSTALFGREALAAREVTRIAGNIETFMAEVTRITAKEGQ